MKLKTLFYPDAWTFTQSEKYRLCNSELEFIIKRLEILTNRIHIFRR